MPRRICLVTPSHLASNPRLVKEADALHDAGYEVHVVWFRYFPPLDLQDQEIYAHAGWSHTVVDATCGLEFSLSKIRRKLTRYALQSGLPVSFRRSVWTHHPACGALARAAAATRSDLYIGHCLAGLVAAAEAARLTGSHYAFDAEDFHSAETFHAENDPVERATIRTIERALLPGCTHITAASLGIGQAYRETYNTAVNPLTVLNVFPAAYAPAQPFAGSPIGQPARLYWFSQTIGPDRGLEPLLAVLSRVHHPCSLHLRGIPAAGFIEYFNQCARAEGFTGTIEWLGFDSPSEMVRLSANYDLGLSLEQSTPRNRDLCLTNKLFTYLLAGLPVAMTPTSAHQAMAPALGDAGLVLNLASPDAAARQLDAWLGSETGRRSAREAAWSLGQETFNWDSEKSRLLTALKSSDRPCASS